MMDIAIREATIADVDRIAQLVSDLGYSTSSGQMHIRMAAILGDEDYRTLVASEGDRIVGFIGAHASEALMAKLDENKADLAKLADPRTIKMDDELADRIARRAAPVYYITGTIHSTEAGAPTALMELAYRLAVDDSAYVRNIREHVITLITPVVEPDGRDRIVDIYEWRKKHPKETPMSPVYWGHYVAHDNNRDAMALTLKLSQNVLNTCLGWKAQVLHDLHESGSFLYDNTIGNGPYNAWLDPILTNEWHLVGWNNVNEMTRMGMPGVYAWGTFDTWSPGYLMFMAATHNGISRLYETFGNSGSADTEERTLTANETSRTWFRQNPPISRVRWSLRNNNNYEQTGLLISLNQIASNRVYFLRNFYEKSKRSILKAKVEGPAAYVFPANDPRPGAQAELLRVLQKQAVEISRATSVFTVTNLKEFIDAGGVFLASNSSAEFAINNFTYGVSLSRPGTSSRVVGSLLRTRLVDDKSPLTYGIPDNLAMYSDNGDSFAVSSNVGGAGRGGGGGGGGAPGGGRGGGPGRPTGRGTPDDPDVVQGRPAVEGSNLPPLPAPPQLQPWQYALPTEEQLRRNPATLIPPQFRPRVAVRFDAQSSLLVSGLLEGGADIAQRPVVVDVPVGKGHVVLFANNPIWRGSTIGSYFLVFNALLNHDSLDAGRTLDTR